MDKVHKSKVDWWLWLALGIPIVGIGTAVYQGLTTDSGILWVALIASAMILVVYGGLVFPMRYTIAADGMRVRAGWFLRLFVPWERLVGARFTRNPLSSPALSLHRIHIDYRKPNGKQTYVLISPVDRTAFLHDIAAASGRHRVDGDTLVAADPRAQR